MAHGIEKVVAIFVFCGLSLLLVCLMTQNWREYEIQLNDTRTDDETNVKIQEGLFWFCRSKINDSNDCRSKWNSFFDIDRKSLYTIFPMCASVVLIIVTAFFGIGNCCCCKKISFSNLVAIHSMLILSVVASASGLFLYQNDFSYKSTFKWSYYLGWVGTGLNLFGIILLLCRKEEYKENVDEFEAEAEPEDRSNISFA